MTWNGVDIPKALRSVKPGEYVLLAYGLPDARLKRKQRRLSHDEAWA